MAHLDIADGHGRQWRVPLDRPRLLVGREPTCDIHLPHPKVSRRHAQLQCTEQGLWILQDLNSLNHVYVDERPEQQVILEAGKRIRIVEFWLTLQDSSTLMEQGASYLPPASPEDSWAGLDSRWLEELQAFHRALLSPGEPRTVLERLAQEFCRIAHPVTVAVGLAGAENYAWEVVLGEDGRPAILVNQADVERRVSQDDSKVQSWNEPVEPRNVGSLMTRGLLFPMKGRLGTIGHVYLRQPRFMPPAVQHYLTVLATLAGLVWDNYHLASLRLAQKAFEQALRQARQIQIELFPSTFEVDARLDVYAVNLPSERVSGDYYDLIRTGPDTLVFIIADAMGHGMPAALMMAAVRASLHMGLALNLPWQDVFKGLDEMIMRARADTFVTGIVGQLDLQQRELQVLCAGHPSPSILVAGKQVPVPAHCQMRPWGLPITTAWAVGRVPLGDDWSILCYTDGITDAGVRAQGSFGSQRIAAYHLKHHERSAEDLCQGLLSEVAFQPGESTLGDDQTVLALRAHLPT